MEPKHTHIIGVQAASMIIHKDLTLISARIRPYCKMGKEEQKYSLKDNENEVLTRSKVGLYNDNKCFWGKITVFNVFMKSVLVTIHIWYSYCSWPGNKWNIQNVNITNCLKSIFPKSRPTFEQITMMYDGCCKYTWPITA